MKRESIDWGKKDSQITYPTKHLHPEYIKNLTYKEFSKFSNKKITCQLKKNLQLESLKLSFIWGKMRAAA